jgi:hypothetical protein
MVGHGEKRMALGEVKALLDKRKKKWTPPELGHPQGVLKRYAEQAASAMKGAYLEN